MHPAARWLDRVLAAVLALSYLSFLISSVFSRREWTDTIAYGLPGANLVVRGALTVPQLGSQFAFDRYWLFNAPLIVLGDVPWFLAAGVGRIPYLLGVVAMGAFNLVVFTAVCRRLLDLASLAFAMLLAFAFLGTRGVVVSDLYNQKYAVAAAGLLLLAFVPLRDHRISDRRRWWQWLAASMVPMVHLVLAPVAIVWLGSAAFERYSGDSATEADAASRSPAGPIAFAIGTAASLAWYGRVTPFITQLWPHITYSGRRLEGSLSGFLDTAASPIASGATWILHGMVVCGAIAIIATAARGRPYRTHGALPAALAIVVLLLLDLWRGYLYYAYVLIGVGPALLAATTISFRRRSVLVAVTVIAIANLAVASRLDRSRPDWTTTAAGTRFLLEHTHAGDRIVLAPPFVFTAATAAPARDVRRIVPQPYYLEAFDRAAWIRDLNACCNVYLGAEEFLHEPVFVQPATNDPFFSDASIERLDFRGGPVVVARKRGP